MFSYCPLQAYEEAKELFARHRGLIAIGGSEWPNIRQVGRRRAPGLAHEQTGALLSSWLAKLVQSSFRQH